MKILVLNSGSSSIKFQLINMEQESVLARGQVSRIGNEEPQLSYKNESEEIKEVINIDDHGEGLEVIKNYLLGEETGVIESAEDIDAVGHRVVHGGEKYPESVLVTEKVKQEIEDLCDLAPLHNPHNLKGIEVCEELFPGTPQAAVFDTSFHQTLSPRAYLYGLPYEYYQK